MTWEFTIDVSTVLEQIEDVTCLSQKSKKPCVSGIEHVCIYLCLDWNNDGNNLECTVNCSGK